MRKIHIVLFLTLVSVISGCVSENLGNDRVKVEGGSVRGLTTDGVHIFRGIPFAAPPLGELRWKAPAPVIPWKGVRSCVDNPPSAMQEVARPFLCYTQEFLIPPEPVSEDCLYLNVWTAAAGNKEKRPVLVWIHGGGFGSGSGTTPIYEGTEMAKKGVVFVTINYRLGIFGFMAHPGLSAESPENVSGNYGILDQIEALKWIRKNITAFGGDPDNVTISGQSAGSFSVNILMSTPLAKGLFQRAIGESGALFGEDLMFTQKLRAAEETGMMIADSLGCGTIAELRKKPAEEILRVHAWLGATIDGYVVPSPSGIFKAGLQNDVPLLTGWNGDDILPFGKVLNAAMFRDDAKKRYGDLAQEFLSLFPAGNDQEAAASQKLVSRMFFEWQNYEWAMLQSTTGDSPAYVYYFTHVPPGDSLCGAFHSAEFGYSLANLKIWGLAFEDYDYELSKAMSSYWVNFARSGDPNGEGLPSWPVFQPGKPRVMHFGESINVIPLPDSAQIAFFDKLRNGNY